MHARNVDVVAVSVSGKNLTFMVFVSGCKRNSLTHLVKSDLKQSLMKQGNCDSDSLRNRDNHEHNTWIYPTVSQWTGLEWFATAFTFRRSQDIFSRCQEIRRVHSIYWFIYTNTSIYNYTTWSNNEQNSFFGSGQTRVRVSRQRRTTDKLSELHSPKLLRKHFENYLLRYG